MGGIAPAGKPKRIVFPPRSLDAWNAKDGVGSSMQLSFGHDIKSTPVTNCVRPNFGKVTVMLPLCKSRLHGRGENGI